MQHNPVDPGAQRRDWGGVRPELRGGESKFRSFKTVFSRPIDLFSPGLRHTLALTHRHLQDGGTVLYSNAHTCHLWSTALVA